jgi:HK97 family phage major capsid protein
VPIPENLLADSNYDIWGEIRPRLVEAFGVKLDQAVLFGTDAPASYEDSVTEAAIAAGNTVNVSATGDDASDVSTLMGQVEADGFDVTGFAARLRLKARLRNLRDTTGSPIFSPSLTAGTPSTLWGESIVYSDANGAWNAEGVDLIGGDWSKLILGVRQDITAKLFTEGVVSDGSGNVSLNLMQQDSVALRVTARYAFSVANPINRRNQNEATRYPFSVLETAEGS